MQQDLAPDAIDLVVLDTEDDDITMRVPQRAAAFLESLRQTSVVSICGPSRTGKSSLMNWFTGSKAFKVGHNDAETFDVRALDTPLPSAQFRDLHSLDVPGPSEADWGMLFVDTEGTGGRSPSYDLSVVIPALLISSCIIVNYKDWQPDLITTGLKQLAEAASAVNKGGYRLPPVLLLIRDCSDDFCQQKEEVTGHLLAGRVKSRSGYEVDQRKKAHMEAIRNLFASFDIFFLPPPSVTSSKAAIGEMKLSEMDQKFQASFKELAEKVFQAAEKGHPLLGIPDGPLLLEHLRENASGVNVFNRLNLDPPSVMQAAVAHHERSALRALKAQSTLHHYSEEQWRAVCERVLAGFRAALPRGSSLDLNQYETKIRSYATFLRVESDRQCERAMQDALAGVRHSLLLIQNWLWWSEPAETYFLRHTQRCQPIYWARAKGMSGKQYQERLLKELQSYLAEVLGMYKSRCWPFDQAQVDEIIRTELTSRYAQ